MTNPTGRSASTSTTEPTLRSRISSAISRTVRSGAAVTTSSVMTSRISIAARVYGGTPLNSRAVAHRTPRQLARRRQIEGLIGVAAPFLDLLLFAGDRVARVAGRNDIAPDPPRLGRRGSRTPLGGPTGIPDRRG